MLGLLNIVLILTTFGTVIAIFFPPDLLSIKYRKLKSRFTLVVIMVLLFLITIGIRSSVFNESEKQGPKWDYINDAIVMLGTVTVMVLIVGWCVFFAIVFLRSFNNIFAGNSHVTKYKEQDLTNAYQPFAIPVTIYQPPANTTHSPSIKDDVISVYYKPLEGRAKVFNLFDWRDDGKYISGHDVDDNLTYKTLRKDRVENYYNGQEQFVHDPFGASYEYRHAKSSAHQSIRRNNKRQTEILFTAFATDDRAKLEALASANGMRVVKSVTEHIAYVCYGDLRRSGKVLKAKNAGAIVLNEQQLKSLFETGELPA